MGGGFQPCADAADGPKGVFTDEGLVVMGGSLQGGKVVCCSDIAEGHADIAQKTAALGAEDGRAAEERFEIMVVEGEEFAQGFLEYIGPWRECGIARGAGEAVPRAGIEAIVAAENAVAYCFAEFHRDGALVLDGEERDATAGVELVRGGDGLRGAGIDAARAFPAAVGQRNVGIQFKRGENDRKEKPGAELRVDAHGALAVPRNAAGGCPVTLENGSAVDKAALLAARFFHPGGEHFQARAQHFVVIVTPRVAGDAPCAGGGWRVLVEIVGGENESRLGAGEQAARIGAVLGRALHPLHGGLVSFGQPIGERVGVRGAGETDDSAESETEIDGGGAEGLFFHAAKEIGWPAWTRTMNNGSKGRCVTITPRASNGHPTWLNAVAVASFDVWVWLNRGKQKTRGIASPGLVWCAKDAPQMVSCSLGWCRTRCRRRGRRPGSLCCFRNGRRWCP